MIPDHATVALVVTAGRRACALPLVHVLETMPLLPVEPLPGAPPFVLGLTLVHGQTLPVLSLAGLLDPARRDEAASRLVTLRIGERKVALSVAAVNGVRVLDGAKLQALPALLHGAGAETIERIATLDAELLYVLAASRLLPEAALDGLELAGKRS